MKLLTAGLAMLLVAIAMSIFSDLNPATPFIGGGVCTFLGIIHLLTGPDRGSSASTSDAVNLVKDINRDH